jgi:hypothetical protein
MKKIINIGYNWKVVGNKLDVNFWYAIINFVTYEKQMMIYGTYCSQMCE